MDIKPQYLNQHDHCRKESDTKCETKCETDLLIQQIVLPYCTVHKVVLLSLICIREHVKINFYSEKSAKEGGLTQKYPENSISIFFYKRSGTFRDEKLYILLLLQIKVIRPYGRVILVPFKKCIFQFPISAVQLEMYIICYVWVYHPLPTYVHLKI